MLRAAAIEALSTADPTRADAMFALAEAYRATGARPQEIRTLARVVRDHPDDPHMDRILFRLGRALFATGQEDTARVVLMRLIGSHPASEYVQAALTTFGDFYAAERDLEAARQFYTRAIAAPGRWTVYAHYRIAWARAGLGDLEGARSLDDAHMALGAQGALVPQLLRRAIDLDRPRVIALGHCP